MKKKDFEKITITDITSRAGVSRMAFYRNYETKGEILFKHLDELSADYYEAVMKKSGGIYAFALHFFDYFGKNSDLVLSIIKANLQTELREKLSFYLQDFFKRMHGIEIQDPPSSVNLATSFFVGGLFNLLVYWIKTGMRESVEEMAAIVERFDFHATSAF